MQKKYLFKKKLDKLLISVTKRIESFFNFFKENFFYKKNFSKSVKTIDKKIFISFAVIFISIITYFLIPAFYDKNKIKHQLENQILNRYNLEVKLENNFNYGLFPKPHFLFKNTIIQYKEREIAKSNDLKVFISPRNFFVSEKLDFNYLVFNKTDFKIKNSNFKFFIDLLNTRKNNKKLDFLNSNFFYLDQNDDIVFLTNLKNINYLYQDDLIQNLNSKLDIFNIPINLYADHNILEKKFFIEIKSLPLRLNIKINSSYEKEKLNGELDLALVNKNLKMNYDLENSHLKFNTKSNEIDGDINIKPFFISVNLNLFYINFKKIFEENSILINFLKSETLNNKNLNGNINVKSNNFKSLKNLFDQIKFNILLEEGEIFIQNLKTNFKDSVTINLDETQLIVDDNKLKFAGFTTLDFIDVKKFFEHYQINIKDRKYIQKLNFGFLFHFDDKFIEIDNLKVDGKTNKNLIKFLDEFNSKKENVFNKIIIRNSVKDFFKIISLD